MGTGRYVNGGYGRYFLATRQKSMEKLGVKQIIEDDDCVVPCTVHENGVFRDTHQLPSSNVCSRVHSNIGCLVGLG